MSITISKLLYQLFLYIYHFGIWLSAFFNKKAAKWIAGRKNENETLNEIAKLENVVWFHCASFGEFLQGKPLIDLVRTEMKSENVVVSFFSPSGYEQVKKKFPELPIFYLPLDNFKASKILIQKIKPSKVIFVKYEWWFFYFEALAELKIPTYVVAAIFRKDQLFFKPWGMLHRKMLHCCEKIFIQNETSANLLSSIDATNYELSGDTRFDAVLNKNFEKSLPQNLIDFAENEKVILIGSAYKTEDSFALKLAQESEFEDFKFVLVPHEIDHVYLQELAEKFEDCLLYSKVTDSNKISSKYLIINKIGLLFQLYQIADFVIVGGGFNKGIHNILEPVSFGKTVFVGPKHGKSNEANFLISKGKVFTFDNYSKLKKQLILLSENKKMQKEINDFYLNYISENAGVAQKIFNSIYHL